MKRLNVINENYFKALIVILGSLLLYNLYSIIISKNLFGLLPILIQSVLIYFLITKNPNSQRANKLWLIIVFFGAQIVRILSEVVQVWAKYMKGEENALEMLVSNRVIYSVMLIVFGMIIWILNRDFAELEEANPDPHSP